MTWPTRHHGYGCSPTLTFCRILTLTFRRRHHVGSPTCCPAPIVRWLPHCTTGYTAWIHYCTTPCRPHGLVHLGQLLCQPWHPHWPHAHRQPHPTASAPECWQRGVNALKKARWNSTCAPLVRSLPSWGPKTPAWIAWERSTFAYAANFLRTKKRTRHQCVATPSHSNSSLMSTNGPTPLTHKASTSPSLPWLPSSSSFGRENTALVVPTHVAVSSGSMSTSSWAHGNYQQQPPHSLTSPVPPSWPSPSPTKEWHQGWVPGPRHHQPPIYRPRQTPCLHRSTPLSRPMPSHSTPGVSQLQEPMDNYQVHRHHHSPLHLRHGHCWRAGLHPPQNFHTPDARGRCNGSPAKQYGHISHQTAQAMVLRHNDAVSPHHHHAAYARLCQIDGGKRQIYPDSQVILIHGLEWGPLGLPGGVQHGYSLCSSEPK